MSIQTNAENALAAEREGYNRAVRDCLKLLAKWFWASAPETKSCRAAMQNLLQD